MEENEEYMFLLEGTPITIRLEKLVDADGQITYYARSDFMDVCTRAANWMAVLEKCVKKIKFAMKQQKKEVELMKHDKAVALAEKFFLDTYINRTLIRDHLDELWHEDSVEDGTLTFFVGKGGDMDHPDDLCKDKLLDDPPITVAVVYVNLLTGECDMVENIEGLKLYKNY